jgi:type III pantothenate kinase
VRTLALDLGNSTLFAGLFDGERLLRSARIDADRAALRRFIRGKVDCVALCSVVPDRTAALVKTVRSALSVDPLVLTPLSEHGLKITYTVPAKLGADRVAVALGATKLFPKQNAIVVDCGTATTLTFLRRDGTLLGGAILPGLDLWPEALARRTARLPEVKLRPAKCVVARDTEEALRSGILHGHAGAIRELIREGRREVFGRARAVVIGTGGQVTHFNRHRLFTATEPGLILHGLQLFATRQTTHA